MTLARILVFPLQVVGGILGGIIVGILVILFNIYIIVHQKLGAMGILKKTIKGYPYKN